MLVRLHSEATTTPKIRAEIQASNVSYSPTLGQFPV